LNFSERKSCQRFIFQIEETVIISFFEDEKPSGFFYTSRRHFIFRREETVDIVYFGEKKPSKVYVSESKTRRIFISQAEEAAEIIFLSDFSGLD